MSVSTLFGANQLSLQCASLSVDDLSVSATVTGDFSINGTIGLDGGLDASGIVAAGGGFETAADSLFGGIEASALVLPSLTENDSVTAVLGLNGDSAVRTNIGSGSYIPTWSGGSPTEVWGSWIRLGGVVKVDAVAKLVAMTNGLLTCSVSLPVPPSSSFVGTGEELQGVAQISQVELAQLSTVSATAGGITASVALQLVSSASGTFTRDVSLSFSYLVG